VEFAHRRPTDQSLWWVEQALGERAHVVAWRRLTGGIVSAVHRVTVDAGDRRQVLVLRQFERAGPEEGRLIEHEAAILRQLPGQGIPAPECVADDAGGRDTDGHPSILMTRVPGRVQLRPADHVLWLSQLATHAARIHSASVTAPEFRPWIKPDDLRVPASATRPDLWRAMIGILRERGGGSERSFIHRDFQHFNVLWRRDRLTGIIDWGTSGMGPPDIDVGHCRLNLAILFGPDWAERFLIAYQAETGRAGDPWWDLHAIASYDDGWPKFIPVQVHGRIEVDTVGMTARVENLIEATLRRF
jgi:aminoglycoside phosphotransferase (APT) family kinase protein